MQSYLEDKDIQKEAITLLYNLSCDLGKSFIVVYYKLNTVN